MHEFFSENLRNPAHIRRAGLMRQFSSGQLYSIQVHVATKFSITGTILGTVLYFWLRQNQCMARARRRRAGFRKFP